MLSHPASTPADLAALQAGEPHALDRLIERWEKPLLAFAWRYVRRPAVARDLVAETFVRLHEQRQRLRPDTNLAAWLFTTLANLCRNQHRWEHRHPTESLEAATASGWSAPATASPAPDEALLQKEALAALEVALASLPHELKTTLLLHHYEHLSYREIGAITGCQERGVETRLYRARQALRSALSAFFHEAAPR